jgi:Phospholipase_D-nuclease N-terminal
MGRALPLVVAVVLAIYCLVQLAQSRADLVRTLPRWLWALLIAGIPVLGPVAWLVLGRPRGPRASPPPGQARPLAPDDDPDFLRRLRDNGPHQNPDDH